MNLTSEVIPTFELETNLTDDFHHVTLTLDFELGTVGVAVDDRVIAFDTTETDTVPLRAECTGVPLDSSLEIWLGARFIRPARTFDVYFDDVVLRALP